MAKFLNTSGISYKLEGIIKDAKERLIIISPFLKINSRLKDLLEDQDRMKIDIRVIYGKSELQPDENKWLQSMMSIRTSFCDDLHAKCYLNENHALITSMNLYEFSQINNHEMGIVVSKEEDKELYDEIYSEAQRLLRISDEVKISVERVPKETEKKVTEPKSATGKGHCIRCDAEIKLDPTAPYCRDCYRIWNKYGDEEYPEQFCHVCGCHKKTSFIKPTCYPCYKKNKDTLTFNL